MAKRILIVGGLCLACLAGCAGTDWTVMSDVKQIAAMRTEVSTPHLAFQRVTVVRMTTDKGQHLEVTSVGPVIVSAQKNGLPAAKTTFTFSPKGDRLVLFSQDVPHWKAFHKEIPLADLAPGKTFTFPVVQESGEVVPQTFTVERVITQ